MDPDRAMYCWRRMTREQREAVFNERKRYPRPWHGPPHYRSETSLYLLSAACYEHHSIIGVSPQRMAEFESDLLRTTAELAQTILAWVVLPNHYHLLVDTGDILGLLKGHGQLHGRTSFRWNGEDVRRGRQVWHRAAETAMKSERHFWATFNYVLHNAVRHGYVERWHDWPYSSAAQYLEEVGRELAEWRWREYPILDYRNEWDPPEF
jgi:putative transposase